MKQEQRDGEEEGDPGKACFFSERGVLTRFGEKVWGELFPRRVSGSAKNEAEEKE